MASAGIVRDGGEFRSFGKAEADGSMLSGNATFRLS
jgi:hypothetical protein